MWRLLGRDGWEAGPWRRPPCCVVRLRACGEETGNEDKMEYGLGWGK